MGSCDSLVKSYIRITVTVDMDMSKIVFDRQKQLEI
ncbi:MAG: hypothetical protein ACI8WT_003416 [Clostridium sp.]|jgi:hypothetical protein